MGSDHSNYVKIGFWLS